jgi:hypothetical protein
MRIEHVIYLSSAGCALWSWQGTRFAESAVRTAVGVDPGPLAVELGRLKAGPIAVLVDMTDEEHVRETVAKISRRDQQALLERKLARSFPRTAFRVAQIQGRAAGGEDEQKVLLSALTRPEPLRILLQRLAEARLPVAGVFSPALLTERLLDPQAQRAPAVMLVLRRSNGRLQHSYFLGGRLAGSRRLRAAAPNLADDPALMLRQLEESLRYFDPSFTVSAERPLQVVLSTADLQRLSAGHESGEGWQLRAIDPAELRGRLGIRAEVGAGETDRVFIEMLRSPGRVANFAPPVERRYFDMFRLGLYGRVACVALAGAAAAGALVNALAIVGASREADGWSATRGHLERVLPHDAAGLPNRIDPLDMQLAVTAYEALAQRQVEPASVLGVIGAAVSERPRIQVDAIEWRTEPAPPAEAAVEDDAAVEADEASMAAGDEGVAVTLRGHIEPFQGDFALAFAELHALVAALEADPQVAAVTTRAQPLDVDPASTLSGELTVASSQAEAAFELDIRLQPRQPAGPMDLVARSR